MTEPIRTDRVPVAPPPRLSKPTGRRRLALAASQRTNLRASSVGGSGLRRETIERSKQ